MNKKDNFIKNTLKLSFGIFINKPIGFLRDLLQMKYFGLNSLSDAYIVAWRIPNIFRRIFSEGLMTSVLLPYLLQIEKEEEKEILYKTITVISVVMQLVITIICVLIAWQSTKIITMLSPGALNRIFYGAEMLKILIFFTFFISFSSILGVAVQLYKNFYVGVISQFFLNIFFCIELFFASYYKLSYLTLATLITGNGILIFIIHLLAFYKYNFYFSIPNVRSIKLAIVFFKKFFIALISALLLETNLFVGLSLSSYLLPGLLSLFEYVNTLIRVPLQVIGSAIATTSSVDTSQLIYDKNLTALENKIYSLIKIFLILSLLCFVGIFLFSETIFTLYFNITSISSDKIILAANLLIIFSTMIFPALCNKVLLNIFYGYHSVVLPTLITFFSGIINNLIIWFFVTDYGLYAVVFSAVFFEWLRFFVFCIFLAKNYQFQLLKPEYIKEIKFIGLSFCLSALIIYLIGRIVEIVFKNKIYYIYQKEFLFFLLFFFFIYLFYTIMKKFTVTMKII